MSRRFAVVAVLAAAFGTGAWAADDKKDQGKAGSGQDAASKYLKEHDKNGDGSLSRDELPADQRDSFADLDTNKDSKLSADELKQHAERVVFVPVPVPVEIVSLYVVEGADDEPTLKQVQETYDMLRKAATNNDGKITKDEATAAREHAIQKRVDSLFKQNDKNNDGKLSKDECPDSMTAMFKRADKDGNGSITKDELMDCCKTACKAEKTSTDDKK